MNHNRDSTVSSIVDLYGAEAPATEVYDRERHPVIQEEDSSDHLAIQAGSFPEQGQGLPGGSSSTGLPPPLQDLSLDEPGQSSGLRQRSIHPSRSALTSGSSYEPSSISQSHLREQSSTSSSFRAAPESFQSHNNNTANNGAARFMNGRIGINGAYNESAASFTSVQQPGEEDDAYHVRSTYARLEVQGVYGDGWDEGIERTRERAIVKRRTSDPPAQRGDGLGEKERQALGRVDRYGFFDQAMKARQESRLSLLPSKPFKSIPKLPKTKPKSLSQPSAGPSTSQAEEAPNLPLAMVEKLSAESVGKAKVKEKRRVSKWERMLRVGERDGGMNISRWTWEQDRKGQKLPERVYKGIPDRWRAAAWGAMAEMRAGRSGPSSPNMARLDETYRKTLDDSSSYDVQIDLDVPRTISGHILFHTRYGHGQRSLFHVLHCFSMHCKECGYCQGMGPIAATLLSYFDAPRVYAMMVRIHDVYRMHSIFIHGFPGLLECFYVQERLIESLMPDVYVSMRDNMISSSSYATKWYITLFANTVPYQTQLRIWDAFFLDGLDALIMASVGIIWAHRASIGTPKANFETILSSLSSFYIPEDEDTFLRWMRKMLNQPNMRNRLDGWRKEWQGLVERKEDGKALL